MEFVWYANQTGFTLWKRFEDDGVEKERPIYNQQQQAQWLTEEVRSDNDLEELSEDFLECLNQLRNEIHASKEGQKGEAQTIAEYRKELHKELDFKETKVVSEILMYYAKDHLTPIDEMEELLDYAAEHSNLDLTDLDAENGGENPQ